MTETLRSAEIPSLLQNVLVNGALPDSVKRQGELLLQRLSSPVRVVLLGPHGKEKEQLLEMLKARPIEDTIICLAQNDCDVTSVQADICLWCTSDFDGAEAAQWQKAPEHLKDHSFLVPLATQENAPTRFAAKTLDALADLASEEFHSMYPVILGPLDCDGPCSTSRDLVAEITNLVSSGRAADQDMAELFLQTYAPMAAATTGPVARKTEEAPANEKVALPPQPGGDVLAAEDPPVDLYQQALGHIRECVADMKPPESVDDGAEIDMVLSTCLETTEAIAGMFSDHESKYPDFLMLKEDVLCSADKLLLMSIEGGVAPAITAVTTLLQTQREIEARLAG